MSKMPRYQRPHIPDFNKLVQTVSTVANEVASTAVQSFAEQEREAFVRRIEQQDFQSFDAAPLTPRYAAWKAKKGLDPRIMIATGWYKGKIETFKRKNSKLSTTFHVGFKARTLARDEKGQRVPFPLWKVARVHEKGSVKMHIPARPHWRPHLKTMAMHAAPVRTGIRLAVIKRLRKAMPGMN